MNLVILTPCHDGLYHGNYVAGLAVAMRSRYFRGYMPLAMESCVTRARSRLACLALDAPEFMDVEGFLWVDADIGFTLADFERIAQHPADIDIVGGVYRKKGGDRAPVYRGVIGEEHPHDRNLAKVAGVGFGFVRTTRQALEDVRSESPLTSGGWHYMFREGIKNLNTLEWLSEDYHFCESAGYPTYLDRLIRLTHRGNQEVVA